MPFTSPKTKSIFVARRDELKQFTNALNKPQVQLFGCKAPPGYGKTVLLAKFKDVAQDKGVECSGIIDFHNVETHERSSLLRLLQTRIDPKGRRFQNFLPAFQAYTDLVQQSRSGTRGSEEIEASVLKQALENELEQFFTDFNKLANSKSVVLLFDTFEEVAGLEVGRWLLAQFVGRVEKTVVVVAGRPQPTETDSKGREISPGVNWVEKVQKISNARVFKLDRFKREDTIMDP